MTEIKLLPHNESGYDDMIKCLEDNQFVSLNRATGTGKSFILLKYLYNNRNKRILYIAPTYQILYQLKVNHCEELGISRFDFKKFDTMIYRNLLGLDMEELASSYDIIVIDEYHRCGALKWGVKIKELMDIIKRKYPNIKVIGTTATEIRYLDHEKNMKDLLFDGVEASRLSLADSILGGILPAPLYINCDLTLLDTIDDLRKRVNKYIIDEKYKEVVFNRLDFLYKKLVYIIRENDLIRSCIRENEKYLVFSSTIEKIEEDKKKIKNFFENKDLVEYEVHSLNKRQKNFEILENFRNDKNKTSILYSVDILNEGVHVKDVFATIFCRKTSSPIIYFQQLGRLLSFSKRNDQVVVIDTVGNIRNHHVIYNLYSEVTSRARELIKTDPKNKDRYLKIIDNFRIVDATSKICSEIENLNSELSIEKLIESRLDYDLSILENSNKFSKYLAFVSNTDIRKYYKYLNIDLFKRLKNIDYNEKFKLLDKPEICSLSVEEFVKSLNGFNNLYNLMYRKVKKSFLDVEDFVNNYFKLPTLFYSNSDEFDVALFLNENFDFYSQSEKKYIKSCLQNDYSIYEKICYDVDCEIDYDELFKEIKYIMSKNCCINDKVLKKIEKIMPEEFANLKNYNKKLYDDKINEKLLEEKFIINEKSNYGKSFEFVMNETNKKIEENGIDKVIEEFYKNYLTFIKENKCIPNYINLYSDGTLTNDENKICECTLFYQKNMFILYLEEKGYLDVINKLINDIDNLKSKMLEKEFLEEIFDFMNNHNGALPSSKNPDIKEKELAKKFNSKKNSLTFESKKILDDKLKDLLKKKDEFIKLYCDFIKEKNRYPLLTNDDEKELIYYLNRWDSYLTLSDKKKLKILNRFELLQNAYGNMKKMK